MGALSRLQRREHPAPSGRTVSGDHRRPVRGALSEGEFSCSPAPRGRGRSAAPQEQSICSLQAAHATCPHFPLPGFFLPALFLPTINQLEKPASSRRRGTSLFPNRLIN